MPTGYTAKLCKEEQGFDEFVLRCARAFGALVTMREEPFDAEIPERFETSDYYDKQLEKAKAEYERVRKMSMATAKVQAETKLDTETDSAKKRIAETLEIRERLLRMRKKVEGWNPPTAEHVELRKFMLQQLDDTIKHDGDASYYYRKLDSNHEVIPEEYIRDKLTELKRDIDYYREERQKEIDRINGRNEWIRQLRESIR